MEVERYKEEGSSIYVDKSDDPPSPSIVGEGGEEKEGLGYPAPVEEAKENPPPHLYHQH